MQVKDWISLVPLGFGLGASVLLLGPDLFLKQSESAGVGAPVPAGPPPTQTSPWWQIALVLVLPPALVAAIVATFPDPWRQISVLGIVLIMAGLGFVSGSGIQQRIAGAFIFAGDAVLGILVGLAITSYAVPLTQRWLQSGTGPPWVHGLVASVLTMGLAAGVLARLRGTGITQPLNPGPAPKDSLPQLRGVADPCAELIEYLQAASVLNEEIARGHASRIRLSVTIVLIGLVGSLVLKLWVSFGS